jgi:hypothetical protein
MEPRAPAAEPPHTPDAGAASAFLEDISRDLAALSEVAECGMVAMRDLAERVKRGEAADAAMAVDRMSRAIRRTIALKMRLRAELMAAMRGQHLPPARAVTIAAGDPGADADGAEADDTDDPEREERAPNLLGDLYDRAEFGDEIGNTPSVEVYRSVCRVLGIAPDETLFRRDARPAAAPAREDGADVAVMERPRERGGPDRPARDWPGRARHGRDPPRSG